MADLNEAELLPCPMCGGKARALTGMVEFIDVEITCTKCSLTGGNENAGTTHADNLSAAIDAWNRRTPDAGGGALLNALQKAYDLPRGARWWPEMVEDKKAIRRLQNSPLLLSVIDAALSHPAPEAASRIAELEALLDEVGKALTAGIGFMVHDDDCTVNHYPGHDACSCGASAAIRQARTVADRIEGEG